MLRAALSLRYLMLVAALGAVLGALLMLFEAGAKLTAGFRTLLHLHGSNGPSVMSSVMGATDASLFGIVLLFFAYGVTFGFVVELDPETRRRLPRWMRIESVSELKHTLVEVILVYLVVDFATDVADAATPLTWDSLVLPTAILLLAGALRLISRSEPHGSA